MKDHNETCPRCGGDNISHNGVTTPELHPEHHYGCRDCWNTWVMPDPTTIKTKAKVKHREVRYKAEERHAAHHRDEVRYKCEEHDAWEDFYSLDFTGKNDPRFDLDFTK